MWYKLAITKVDPSGQINMDFSGKNTYPLNPGEKPKRFDLSNLKFEVVQEDPIKYPEEYTLYALLNDGRKLGYIYFEAPDNSETADIKYTSIYEYPTSIGEKEYGKPVNSEDKTKSEYLDQLSSAGYLVDDSSVTRTDWGIGKTLYQELKKFLQENKPNIKFVTGKVHSKEAFWARYKGLGFPVEALDPYQSYNKEIKEKHSNLSEEEKLKMIRNMANELGSSSFDSSGRSDAPKWEFNVKNKIENLPSNDKQKFQTSDVNLFEED
jgi:hypothetical protein